MRRLTLMSLAVASILLSGCGGGSSTSTDGITSGVTTFTVERGPILKATVVDANGQKATDVGNGKYTFTSAAVYPVMAVGGVIDMDRDGVVSIGDVSSDLNLTTTGGSVITVATTLASNPATKAELEKIAVDLNLTMADIISKTPSTSKEVEAISNIAYKYMKDNNIRNLQDSLNQKLVNLNISAEVHNEYQSYVNDDTHDNVQEEKNLMDSIVLTNIDAVNHLENDAEVEHELNRIKTEYESLDLNGIKDELLTLKSEYESEYGDLDYEDEGNDVNHYQGLACATCHGGGTARALLTGSSEGNEGNEGNENSFTSGATIFTKIDTLDNNALQAASNYSLRLVLESGAKQGYRIGRGTGNVNETFNAGIAKYTAEVLDRSGKVVNSSLKNSHDSSRFDCNSCHTAGGKNGAPGRIVSFKYVVPVVIIPDTNTTTVPTDTNTTVPVDTNTTTSTVVTQSFATDVLPILNTKCAICHGSYGNFSITNSRTPYEGVTPFVNTTTATASALLTKASGTISHGGNVVIATTTAEYTTVSDWISEGALNN